nr:hypothetical protein [Tanacetum cinerariifolium]
TSSRLKISFRLLKIQVAQKKVKKAFENADSSSRVELIPSKIKFSVVLKVDFVFAERWAISRNVRCFPSKCFFLFLMNGNKTLFSSSLSRADMPTGRRESFSMKAYSRCLGRGISSILIAMNYTNSWSRDDSLIFSDVAKNGLESSSNASNSSSVTSSLISMRKHVSS